MRTTLTMLATGASMLALATAANADTVRVSGWGGAEVAIINALITDVLADQIAEAGIEVVYEPIDGDFPQFIINALSAGTAPDLFYTDIFWGLSIFEPGQADPVTQDVSAFAPNLIEAFTYEGEVMAIPKDFNTLALFYNRDIFDDAGVDYPTDEETWGSLQEKLLAVNSALPDVEGFCIVADYARFAAVALSTGWEPFDAEGRTVLDDNFRRAFEQYTGMVAAGAAVNAADVGQDWGGGCLVNEISAVAIEGAWILGAVADSAPNLNYGVARLPSDETSGLSGNMIFTVGWTVNANSPVAESAHRLAELLTSEEAQTYVLENGLALPSRSSLADSEWTQGDEPAQVTNRVVFAGLEDDNVEPFFFGQLGGSWMAPINAALSSVLLGESDVDAAIAQAQAELDRLQAN